MSDDEPEHEDYHRQHEVKVAPPYAAGRMALQLKPQVHVAWCPGLPGAGASRHAREALEHPAERGHVRCRAHGERVFEVIHVIS